MSLQELQSYTFTTKYARYDASKGRRETYDESVDRVFSMHERRYADKGIDAEMAFAKAAMKDRLVLGSQRALQFGGKPIESKNARLFNCSVSYADRPRFFQESLWMLLCGCGVGFSVQKHHTANLPHIATPLGDEVTYVIPDSIEGWADALGVLLSSYFMVGQPFPEYANQPVTFDYSQIRPRGATIASGSGKAPGPEPLKRSLDKIRETLDERLAMVGGIGKLRSIDVYDIVMHASDAVLSGGVRRSATICLFSPDDQEMATAKTGDWFIKNPQRGRSNNSALLLRDSTTYEDFAVLMKSVKEFGEPGFVWADNTEVLLNPCCEIAMYPRDDETGVSGWSVCNLCEINMKLCDTYEKFERACRAAAILGTLQAGYTDFAYLGPISEKIIRREALLGVSMTGMMDTPKIAFDPVAQREMASLIKEVNADIAARIGINVAARTTCVKPAGSTSCILGTSSGIHPHHAGRYFRRVQANTTEAPLAYFKAHNPRAVETSVWNPNGTDDSIIFCVTVPKDALVKNSLSAVQLLDYVRLTQDNWVSHGRRLEACVKPWLQHNVSNTITVRDDEWGDVTDYIYQHRNSFTGISLLPAGGDLDYPQAPFCAVPTYEEVVGEYGVGALFASGLIVDGLHAFTDNIWAACDCALDRGQDYSQAPEKGDWVRRAKKFAANYFGGDIRKMTYCLKRVHNCKLWEDLTREYQPVDYSLMLEATDETTISETIACGGGACELK